MGQNMKSTPRHRYSINTLCRRSNCICVHPEMLTTHILLLIKEHQFQIPSDVNLEIDTATPRAAAIN